MTDYEQRVRAAAELIAENLTGDYFQQFMAIMELAGILPEEDDK